ncbi:L,D-transpeptidase [Acidocella sp.]|uniref:L,D-transpeptidase family protein n=1 Tax=Acidocella sp. TaxID=50710 RepID=UPI0026306AAE|nr:L,D-transpeptidase family protein [Acidocella sp.]
MAEFMYNRGMLAGAGLVLRACCGRRGVIAGDLKREGDGATPKALMRLVRVFYRPDRFAGRPKASVPMVPLSTQDAWCDDPANPDYNRLVKLPFGASHELLWREDERYDLIGVLDWNLGPITPGRGSAIFFHVAPPGYTPTEGCIGVSREDALAALAAGMDAINVVGE